MKPKYKLIHMGTGLPVEFGEILTHINNWQAPFIGAEIPEDAPPVGWVWARIPNQGGKMHYYSPESFNLKFIDL